MGISKDLVKSILIKLDKKFGNTVTDFTELAPEKPEDEIIQHLKYLEGHRYVKNHYTRTYGFGMIITGTEITSHGHDYISEDGGITADNFVNVKLHNETLSVLLSAIDASNNTADTKNKLKKVLSELPVNTVTIIATAAINAVIENLKQQIGIA